jgi:hypothetical protein
MRISLTAIGHLFKGFYLFLQEIEALANTDNQPQVGTPPPVGTPVIISSVTPDSSVAPVSTPIS